MTRQIEGLEKRNYYRNLLSTYSCFIVGGRLNIKFENKDVLREAVRQLFESRKQLRLNVFKDDQNNTLVEKEIENGWDSKEVVEFMNTSEDYSITEILNDLHEKTFKLEVQKPMWKIVVVNQEWIMVLCDHTLYDGTTAALILEDLLTLLNKEGLPVDKDLNLSKVCSVMARNMKHLMGQDGLKMLVLRKETFRTLKQLISIDMEDFMKLKKLIDLHGVKFTAFWVYLSIISLSKIKNHDNIKVSVPCNLRSLLPSNFENHYGLFVSAVFLNLKPVATENIDWDYVKFINSTITRNELIKGASLIGMLKYVDPKEGVSKEATSPRKTTYEISNLGLRKIPTLDNQVYSFDEFIFSQPNSLTGTQLTNSVISSSKKVNIVVDGTPETKSFYHQYVQILNSQLQEILSSI
ncbi:unnamed protein product [Wickerhamomyces anomalus]